MTLTEFLLARIAEDEWHIRFFGQPARHCASLEDVEAKRRIVRNCLAWDDEPNAGNLSESILRDLAAVYADHADFDPTWLT